MLIPQLTGQEQCRQPLQHTGILEQPSRSQQSRQRLAMPLACSSMQLWLQRSSNARQRTPPDGAIAAAGQKPGLHPRF